MGKPKTLVKNLRSAYTPQEIAQIKRELDELEALAALTSRKGN